MIYKSCVFLTNLEAEKQEDSVITKETNAIVKILNKRLPTKGLIVEYPEQIEDLLRPYDPETTIVFNWAEDISGFLHGGQYVAELLARLHFDDSASPPLTQELVFDRSATLRFLRQIGIDTPDFRLLYSPNDAHDWRNKWPVMLRPNKEHGSAGIVIANSAMDAQRKVARLFDKFDPPAIMTTLISPAREFTVGIWSDGEQMEVFPVAEKDFSKQKDDIVGEDDKASSGPSSASINIIPAKISPSLEKQLTDMTAHIFSRFGINIWGRMDYRMPKGSNTPLCIDVNGEPDITKDTVMTEMAKAAGLSYEDLILGILDRTIAKFERKRQMAQEGKAKVEKKSDGSEATIESKG